MKKIPTVFKRVFDGHRIIGILPEITPGCEDAFYNGIMTEKFDGSCCAIHHAKLYKRFDAKPGKLPPLGAVPCQDYPDSVTGHFPYWVECNRENPSDKWFFAAFDNTCRVQKMSYYINELDDNWYTFEAIGVHFNGNPYGFHECDYLIKHGSTIIPNFEPRNFETIREYLRTHDIEGIVFWLNGEPICKIKRSDFGFSWGNKK